jgi:flagellar M-ring protein FliF
MMGAQYVAASSPGAGGMAISTNVAAAPSAANIAAMAGAQEAVAVSNRTAAMIDVAQVQGQVHAQSVEKVGELAEKNPNVAVSIIRNWIHEDVG